MWYWILHLRRDNEACETFAFDKEHSEVHSRRRGPVNPIPIQYDSIHGVWGALEHLVSGELADTRDLQGTTHGCANVAQIGGCEHVRKCRFDHMSYHHLLPVHCRVRRDSGSSRSENPIRMLQCREYTWRKCTWCQWKIHATQRRAKGTALQCADCVGTSLFVWDLEWCMYLQTEYRTLSFAVLLLEHY